MKKPELEDFDLTEELLDQNQKEQNDYEYKLQCWLENRKSIKKAVLIVSLVVFGIFLLINMTNGFAKNLDFAGSALLISGSWGAIYGFYFFTTLEESTWDLNYEKRKELKNQTINQEIDEAVKKYRKAVEEYDAKANSINEYSLVKAELLTPFGTSMGDRWIVFSNIYLSNPRSFPDLENPNIFDYEFQMYYARLMERQRSITPKPKKCLNIDEKLEFYYPCSEVYGAMEHKRPGDTVKTCGGAVVYKIHEVINLDYE